LHPVTHSIISKVLMQRAIDYVPGIALFVAGVAAGVLTSTRMAREQEAASSGTPSLTPGAVIAPPGTVEAPAGKAPIDPAAVGELKRSIHKVESRLEAQETTTAARFGQIEARLDEHAAKFAEVPTTAQIVVAMENLLSRTMASLDERLTTQAHSIEVLKTTVSQTDSLLERVLESLDSLQTYSETPDVSQDALFNRAV